MHLTSCVTDLYDMFLIRQLGTNQTRPQFSFEGERAQGEKNIKEIND